MPIGDSDVINIRDVVTSAVLLMVNSSNITHFKTDFWGTKDHAGR
jgi:hypothetical protein